LNSGLQMAIDGQNPDFIRDVLLEKIEAMEERHEEGALLFSQAGTYAPTLGVLGADVGLIAAIGSIDNMDVLGAAISVAFIATLDSVDEIDVHGTDLSEAFIETLMWIFTCFMIWQSIANKLEQKAIEEVRVKDIMLEGISSITAGQ